MKKFSKFVAEERKNYSSTALLQSEITTYINKVKKAIPANVQKAIYLTQKYNITSGEELDKIRTANKSKLKELVDTFSMPLNELESLWGLMKEIKNNYRLMPQYMTAREREAMELGKLSLDDMTIDLTSAAGRNAAVKIYTPLVMKIVKQFEGKSKLNRADLISVGLEALVIAMNRWQKEPTEEREKVVSFRTYATGVILGYIKNEMSAYGHDLSGGNWYTMDKIKKEKEEGYGTTMLDAISLDGLPRDTDGDFKQDHLAGLGVTDEPKGDEAKSWDLLYKLLERNFKQRDTDVFYRYFGLKGYKREKSKDIAKSLGMSEGNIRNSILNKMIKFLKTNKAALDILGDIQDIYTECLMIDLCGYDRNRIFEELANDNIFLLLEDLCKWRNKNVLTNAIKNSLQNFNIVQRQSLMDIIEGNFDTVDANIRKNGKLIWEFLRYMHPAENFANKTDVLGINLMVDIQDAYHKFNLDSSYFKS